MEIYHAGKRAPTPQYLSRLLAIGPLFELQELLEALLRPAVAAGEDIDPSEAPQKHILGRPRPDTPYTVQEVERIRVAHLLELPERDRSAGDIARKLDDRFCLVKTEPERFQVVGFCSCKDFGPGEGVQRGLPVAKCFTVMPRETVEQEYPDIEGYLLAGEGVDQRFEKGREAGRFSI